MMPCKCCRRKRATRVQRPKRHKTRDDGHTPQPPCTDGCGCDACNFSYGLVVSGFTSAPGCGGSTCSINGSFTLMKVDSFNGGLCDDGSPSSQSCRWSSGGLPFSSATWRCVCVAGTWRLRSIYFGDPDPNTCGAEFNLGGGACPPTGTFTVTLNECAGTGTAVLT